MNCTKIILFIFIIGFCSGINYAQYKNQLSFKQNIPLFTDTTKNVQKLSKKEPAIAGFLSFIAPGFALGQLYNGEEGKFLTHAIIGVTCLTTFIISAHFIEFDLNPGGGNTSEHNEKNSSNIAGALLFFSAVIFAGNYIITIADAVVSANNINKKVRLQKYRSESTDKIRFGFLLNKNKKLRLNFAFDL